MGKLSLNNLSLSDQDTTIPKAERKALERVKEKERRFRKKVTASSVQRDTQKAIQVNTETNALRAFPPGMRFITRDDGVGAGEILTVYEVVSQEGRELIIRSIYGDNDLYGDLHSWTHRVDIRWLRENILAIPGFNTHGPLGLLQYEQEPSPTYAGNISIKGLHTLIVSSKYKPRYHREAIEKLVSLFIKTNHSEDILENSPHMMKIRGFSYEKAYVYKDSMPIMKAFIALGEGFWFSQKYEYLLKEIQKRFYGQKVKITYNGVLLNEESFDDLSTEFAEHPVVGVIGELGKVNALGKNSEMGRFRLSLVNAIQNEEEVKYVPDEIFFTGFIIETIEE